MILILLRVGREVPNNGSMESMHWFIAVGRVCERAERFDGLGWILVAEPLEESNKSGTSLQDPKVERRVAEIHGGSGVRCKLIWRREKTSWWSWVVSDSVPCKSGELILQIR